MQLLPQEETSINLYGEWSTPESMILSDAWLNALGMRHKLTDSVRYMHGMSGKKFRYLLNNLMATVPDPRYLEIGSWSGSTACSAICNNAGQITCIENWSHFGGPRDQFNANTAAVLNDNIKLTLIEKDFREVDYSAIGKFNIYMYDGPHSAEDTYDGLTMVQDALDDMYYLIIDDFNQVKDVQAGVERAFKDLKHKVVASIEVITRTDGEHPQISHENSDWHNGYFIALVSKK